MHSSGSHHGRAHEQGAATGGALTTLEVAIAGAGTDLAPLQTVGVHRQAHRTTGLTPLEPRRPKHLIQTLFLGRLGHLLGTRHHKSSDSISHLPTSRYGSRSSQITEPTIGATSNEADIDRHPGDGGSGLKIHVFVSLLCHWTFTHLQAFRHGN